MNERTNEWMNKRRRGKAAMSSTSEHENTSYRNNASNNNKKNYKKKPKTTTTTITITKTENNERERSPDRWSRGIRFTSSLLLAAGRSAGVIDQLTMCLLTLTLGSALHSPARNNKNRLTTEKSRPTRFEAEFWYDVSFFRFHPTVREKNSGLNFQNTSDSVTNDSFIELSSSQLVL